MTRIVLGSNFHHADLSKVARTWTASLSEPVPASVTLGFRGVFWKVFSAIHELELSEGTIELYGQPWRISRLLALESADATARLGFSDNRNIFLVAMLETEDPSADIDLNATMFAHRDSEQQLVHRVLDRAAELDASGAIASRSHARALPGRFLFQPETEVQDVDLVLSIAAFYFYALLMLWQLEREQVDQALDTPDDELEHATRQLLRQREKIINVTRLFFTTNVSNKREVQRTRKAIMERFRLEPRFARLPAINESIEKYYEIRTQAMLQRQSEQLNRIALVMAFLGLPISVISMLLAIDTRAEILQRPVRILSSPEVQGFLAFSAILCLSVLTILVAVMALRMGPAIRGAVRRLKPAQKKRIVWGPKPK